VAPKETHPGLRSFSKGELHDFAEALKILLIRYDNLWRMPFPYVMSLHHAPIRELDDTFHFHIEFHPPLRKARLLKYLAGPEIGGGNFLGDTLPEEKAAELQNVSNVHYKSKND
jgi:UDPglucose--hexose-1-phosphate uridylyltransferase